MSFAASGCPRGEAAWRDIPFKDSSKPSVKELRVEALGPRPSLACEADGLEFVVCDMQKQSWDNPPDWYGKKNYLISEPWHSPGLSRSAFLLRGRRELLPSKWAPSKETLKPSLRWQQGSVQAECWW